MGLLKILFSLTLLMLPLGELVRYQSSTAVGITANDILIGILVIYWLSYHLCRRKKIKSSYLTKPLIFFTVICLLSLIVNSGFLNLEEFGISFLYIVRWIFYALLFFIVSEFDKSFKHKILVFILLDISLVLLGGFVQYFLYPNLRNLYYLGWDEHLYRMFSSFLDPNFLGEFLVLNFIFVSAFIMKYFKTNNLKLFLYLMLDSVILIAIILTYSRSALIMLVVSVFSFFMLTGIKKIYIFVFLILLTSIIFLSPRAFKTEGTNLLRSTSSSARLASAKEAIYIFEKNPIIGVGFDAYRYAQIRYGFQTDQIKQVSHAGSGTDSSLLFVLATTGIIGLAAYLFMWFRILKCQYQKILGMDKNSKVMGLIFILSAAGLFFGSIFINSLFYPSIMEWIWIVAAL